MSDSVELLTLRLALLAILLAFVLVTAVTLRGGVRSREAFRARDESEVAVARLVLLSPARTGIPTGTEFLVAGEMEIGRAPDSSIVLGDPSVSSRHASLTRNRGRWVLRDLGSTNGTTVNGRRIAERGVAVRAGDEVAFGAVVMRLTL